MGSVRGDSDTGALQGAASRGRAARPIIAPAWPVRRCVVMEHGGGGDGDQPAAAFDPRDTKFVNKFQCSVASERKCDVTRRSVTRNQ